MNELPLTKSDLEISSTKVLPMSDQLLMHVHGGGFIATSSATHEVRFAVNHERYLVDFHLDLFETMGIRIRNPHCLC